MAQAIRRHAAALRDDRMVDLLGGAWLVSLTVGLLYLPALFA